ncbi:hypothetical protein BOX15_Mlig000850g3 [Macrostomum lignano]|uniref:Uncharacterized protein n=1 Tax=Macrostomum lignano TaxID=282301 RepID=A0A267F672_9PLAT|nr:hypothetical protein BOX15_Mlig000850g3 [Macrostomum lignano]
MTTIAIPKTVTSKKGNLSIVSENLKARHVLKKHRRHLGRRLSSSVDSADQSEGTFSAITVDELASTVLNFGSKGNESVCLDIQQMTSTSSQEPKVVRPGFSARRYLASWTKTLDEDTVNTWLSLGKLSEKTIFQTNAFLPHLKKRANDNLSEYPAPYRIVKQMLIAPGPLNEYSFIWSKKEVSDDGLSRGDIQVFSEDKAELVKYSELDKETQKGILSKLLVKSALNYGLSRAQEAKASESGEGTADASSGEGPFDMVHAVRSLLDRDTNALREEGDSGAGGVTREEFSPEDERIFERIRQKRLQDKNVRRQRILQQRARRSGAGGGGSLAMQGEHFGPEFEPPDWERPARPDDGRDGFLPPLVEDQPPMATRGLRTGDHEDGGSGRRPKLPRLAVSLDATASIDSGEEDAEGDTTRREAADRVMELPFEGPARSGPQLFGSMPRARGVWGNFSQRRRPQQSPLQQQQQQQQQEQQEQQQKAGSGRGVQLKTADLFLGTEPESRVSTADEDASTDSNDLASVRLKTRKTRQDARNLRARSPVKREFNLKGGDFDATEFLVAHKAADGPLSDGPSRASSPPSPRTLQSERDEAEAAGQADEEGQDLQLGGKGLIAPAHAGPGGEQIDVAALSQDQLMSVLTQHAEDVAENVLKNQRPGRISQRMCRLPTDCGSEIYVSSFAEKLIIECSQMPLRTS